MSNATDSSDVDLNESYQGNIIVCAVVTWVIASMFVGLRFYLRGYLRKVLGAEDWVILVSLGFSAAHSGGFIASAHYGLGKHTAAIPRENTQPMAEAAWFTILCYALTLCLSKISILLLYLRTLTYDWIRITLRVLMAVVVLTSLANLGAVVTACIPLNAFWDAEVMAKYCHSPEIYYAITGMQIASDFLIFLLPLPVIWSMRVPKDQKVVLLTVFSFGFFICIVSIIRLFEIVINAHDSDYTFAAVAIDYWTLVEVNTSIVCACVMTLKPLLNRILPSSSRLDAASRDPAKSIHPPTIGSRPSRSATAVVRKQSWFTTQMARLDRSLGTVHESETTGEDMNLTTLEAGTQTGSTGHKDEPWLPTGTMTIRGDNRRSHNSSIMTPIEHKPDEGPLGSATRF